VTIVSVPPSPGQIHIHSARGSPTMEHLLVMMVSLPASPLSVGQATIIFFYIGFFADAWARHYFFELKLSPLKYYTP
jgi:hypothetical protein